MTDNQTKRLYKSTNVRNIGLHGRRMPLLLALAGFQGSTAVVVLSLGFVVVWWGLSLAIVRRFG